MNLRDELMVYIELLESIKDCNGGIDGESVPRELRQILKDTEDAK